MQVLSLHYASVLSYCQEVMKRRSPCPVACTLDLIGDRWTLLVIRDLFRGKAYFKEFSAAPEGIASNILSDRLARLVEFGLVEKFTQPDLPGRDAYRLTARGQTLGPLLKAMALWGLEQIEGTSAQLMPVD